MKNMLTYAIPVISRYLAAAIVATFLLTVSGCHCAEPVKEPGCYLVTYKTQSFLGGDPVDRHQTVCTNESVINSGLVLVVEGDCIGIVHYEKVSPLPPPPSPPEFSVCFQDETNPANLLRINMSSGKYRWCCGLTTKYEGIASVNFDGRFFILTHTTSNYVFTAKFLADNFVDNLTPRKAEATLRSTSGETLCSIIEEDFRNSKCDACQ